jgi:hypothetical protein
MLRRSIKCARDVYRTWLPAVIDCACPRYRLAAQRQAPKYLFVGNGSEFSGRLLDLWAYYCKARIDFSRPEATP